MSHAAGPLDDDDVPKPIMRRGDDPILDGAVEQLKGASPDGDPLHRDVADHVRQITDPGAPGLPDHAQHVPPTTIPPTRDPTLEHKRVVLNPGVFASEPMVEGADDCIVALPAGNRNKPTVRRLAPPPTPEAEATPVEKQARAPRALPLTIGVIAVAALAAGWLALRPSTSGGEVPTSAQSAPPVSIATGVSASAPRASDGASSSAPSAATPDAAPSATASPEVTTPAISTGSAPSTTKPGAKAGQPPPAASKLQPSSAAAAAAPTVSSGLTSPPPSTPKPVFDQRKF